MTIPRGIRNNNPGNIRKSDVLWVGKVTGEDPDFETFDTPVRGLRALMMTLLTYYRRHGLDTVQAIINRWAPPSENDTGSYASAVAAELGVAVRDKIAVTAPTTLMALALAIVCHENGNPPTGQPEGWYEPAVYDRACRMALGRDYPQAPA